MAGEPIVEELTLDIAPALASLDPLGTALDGIVLTFSTDLADGLTTALGTLNQIDTSGITDAITQAVTDATATPVPIEGDASGLDTAITDVTDQTQDVPLSADATELTNVIDQTTSQPQVVPIDGDTSQAQEAIGSLDATEVVIPVDADTSGAQDSIDALGTSATGAIGTSGGGGGEGLAGLEGAVLGVKAASGAATGEVGGVTEGINALGGAGTAAALGGGAAFVAFLGEAVSASADAQAQQARFNTIFGQSAEAVKNIDVGGLVISLEDLGKQSGTTNADLEASASRIGLLGTAAGASREQVAGTASDVLGLAGALAVSNPRLGDTATVADTLSRAFSTGRTRALIPFGIALTQAQISAEALRETNKQTAADLTPYEKLVAGVTLALQQQGDTLGTKFAAGAQNAQVQLRALKVEIEETLVAIGTPLLGPVVESLRSLIPIAEDLGRVLGDFGKIAVPAFAALGPAIALLDLPLRGLDTLLNQIPPGALAAAGGIFVLVKAIEAARVLAALGAFDNIVSGLASVATRAAPAIVGLVAFEGTLALLNAAFPITQANVANLTKELTTLGTGTGTDGLSSFDISIQQLSKDVGAGSDGLTRRLEDAGKGLLGFKSGFRDIQDIKQANVDIKAINDSLVGLVQGGNIETARVAFGRLALSLIQQGQSAKEVGIAFQAYRDALDAAQAATKANVEVVNNAGVTAAASAGGYTQLANAIINGNGATLDAAAAAKVLGVQQADVTQFIKDTTAAVAAQSDAQILASGAAQELFAQFASGQIDVLGLEIGLLNLGVSMSAAGKDAQQAKTDLQQFVDTAVNALPQVGSAIDAFSSGIKSAFSDVATATSSGVSAVQSAQQTVDSARESLDRALATSGAAGAKTIDAARQSEQTAQRSLDQAKASADASAQRTIDSAQRALDTARERLGILERSGTASATAVADAQLNVANAQDALNRAVTAGGTAGAAAIANAQARVTTAQNNLNQALAGGGGAGSAAVRSAQDQLSTANKNLVDAQNKSAADVLTAKKALEAAVDPSAFTAQLQARTLAISQFTHSLAILVSEGFGALAGDLASKGADAGGQLAAALASAPNKAKLANAAAQNLQAAQDAAKAFLTDHAGQLHDIGAQYATGINAGITATPLDFSKITQQSIKDAEATVTREFPNLRGVARAFAVEAILGFAQGIDPLTGTARAAAQGATSAITNETPAQQAASQAAGAAATTAFGAALKPDEQVTAQFAATSEAILNQAFNLGGAAFILGERVGFSFDDGITAGLGNPPHLQDIANAAGDIAIIIETVMRQILGIHSPSTVGIELGGQFTDGVAIGLNDTSSVSTATGGIGHTIISGVDKISTDVQHSFAVLGKSSATAFTESIKANIHLGELIPTDTNKAITNPLVVATRPGPAPFTGPLPTAQARGAVDTGARTGRTEPIIVNIREPKADPLHIAAEIAWAVQ